jgi:hypothetical protein
MSNYLAIATVTAALQQVLLPPVQAAVENATVGFKRPDRNGDDKAARVDLYLYQVTPNAAFRNADLPTHRSDGILVRKPQVALDLHYLFTFHGSDDQLQPQRMLGAVVSALQVQPLLTAQNIQAAVSAFGFLAGSGLESQIERVKFTPTSLSLEEFSKLWSAFFQVEYSLSAAYQASVVLIESDDTPQAALRVQARNVYVAPFAQPVITQVVSSAGAGQPIVSGGTLVIQGTALLGDSTVVRIGNKDITPTSGTPTTLTLVVPADVPAGVLGVQVIRQLLLGTPPALHAGYESNVAAIVLQPVIVPGIVSSTQIAVGITPAVQPGQRVMLLLNQTTWTPPAGPAAFSFMLQPPAAATIDLTFSIGGVPAGVYFIRVKVEGAESPLNLTPASPSFGPTVTIP